MKNFSVNVPEGKYEFFKELIENLGFESFEDFEISEEHKEIVRNRIQNSKRENLIPWNKARKMLTRK